MRIEYYKGKKGKWYWRMKAPNGFIIADGAQGYTSKRGVKDAIKRFAKAISKHPVVLSVKRVEK